MQMLNITKDNKIQLIYIVKVTTQRRRQMSKKVPCTNEDRAKSYFKYYAMDIYAGEQAKYDMITEEPLDNSLALKIEDRNDLFLPGELPGEFGWWLMDDGTALIANKTFFPDVDGEMFDWWFAWHQIDRLR